MSHPSIGITPKRPPRTLWVGLALLLICECLLAVNVHQRGGVIVPAPADFHWPHSVDRLDRAARWVAVNMTALCWLAYLFVADGLLTWLARVRGGRPLSPLRARPNRFMVAWLSSVPLWCFFDAVNFYYLDAWRYHGLPSQFSQRLVGYFIAFAAISPGMFMAAELYQRMGMMRLRSGGVRIPPWVRMGCVALGAAFSIYPFLARDPIGSLTLWVALVFLLDPINHALGAPSLTGDWIAGRWGRTLALMAGGATCGLLWEFWNYWALTKWTYRLDFLGSWESVHYFEMPALGFLGFLPFAIECWVALNFLLAVLERFNIRMAEELPDPATVL